MLPTDLLEALASDSSVFSGGSSFSSVAVRSPALRGGASSGALSITDDGASRRNSRSGGLLRIPSSAALDLHHSAGGGSGFEEGWVVLDPARSDGEGEEMLSAVAFFERAADQAAGQPAHDGTSDVGAGSAAAPTAVPAPVVVVIDCLLLRGLIGRVRMQPRPLQRPLRGKSSRRLWACLFAHPL